MYTGYPVACLIGPGRSGRLSMYQWGGGIGRGHWGRYLLYFPAASRIVSSGPGLVLVWLGRFGLGKGGGSGCWESVPGSFQLELGFSCCA